MSAPDGTHYVFLDLSSRSPFGDKPDTSTMQDFQTNRIGLKCDNVSISTAKNILAFPTPAVGIATRDMPTNTFLCRLIFYAI
mgnify:CR=1 FL=1